MKVCFISYLGTVFLLNINFNHGISHVNPETRKQSTNKQAGYDGIPGTTATKDGISKYEIPTINPPIMNTFENVTYWVETEELIFKFAKLLRQELQGEMRKLQKAMVHSKQIGRNSVQKSKISANNELLPMLNLLKESMTFVELGSDKNHVLFKKTSNSSTYFLVSRPDWPNLNDLNFAKESLLNIQEVYNFDYTKLATVMSPETRKPPQLNAFHFAEIGIHALSIEKYAAAIEWLEFALAKTNENSDSSIPLTTVESNLKLAMQIHDEMLVDPSTAESRVVENLFENIVTINTFPSKMRKRRSILQFKGKGALEESRLLAEHKFNAICSGQDLRPVQERSALYCWYDTTSSPARTILPYKKELLSFNPELIQAYDILGEALIASIIMSRDKCSWVAHKLILGNLPEKLRRRTSSLCWSDGPELKSLVRKMASVSLTDLSADGSYAPNNIVGYLFGRIHKVHLDTVLDKAEKSQNVFSTALISQLFYLNDVSAGGSTAFPIAGTAALPIKGSVVYWKNMYRNGSARIDTWHGSCPVIYGHKQALVVGLLPRPQFLTYPCTLNPNE